jgi:hypothetical protein
MITEIQYNKKEKTAKVTGRGVGGYPIYYEKIFTLEDLKRMVKTLSD